MEEENAGMQANGKRRTGQGRKETQRMGRENKLENIRIDLAQGGAHADF